MRGISAVLAFVVCLSFVTAVAAQEEKKPALEELMLRDGTTAMVEVVKTEPEHVTVKFTTKEGASGQSRIHANALDPHSFYMIRKTHMEKTAENHVKLAIFCVSAGLFKRAKRQMDAARALDPEIDQKIKDLPDVMEKIADHLYQAARRHYEQGNLEVCYEIASLLATRFGETIAGEKARSVLKELADELDAQVEKRQKDREAAIEAEQDAEKQKAAKARQKIVKPLEKSYNVARNHVNAGLQERNQSRARKLFEAGATEFESLLKKIEAAKKSAGDDAQLVKDLEQADTMIRKEAIRAWINAGNISLARGSRPAAAKYGQAALALDPENEAAKSFMNQVQLASAMSGWGRWR